MQYKPYLEKTLKNKWLPGIVKEDDLKWWSRDFVRTYKAYAVAANAGFYLPANPVVRRVAHSVGEPGSVELY